MYNVYAMIEGENVCVYHGTDLIQASKMYSWAMQYHHNGILVRR